MTQNSQSPQDDRAPAPWWVVLLILLGGLGAIGGGIWMLVDLYRQWLASPSDFFATGGYWFIIVVMMIFLVGFVLLGSLKTPKK